MLIWNRDTNIEAIDDVDDREYVISSMLSKDEELLLNFVDILINVTIPAIIICFFKFNLLAFAIGFILTDIILNTIDWICFIRIPYNKTMNASLPYLQKRLEKINNKVAKIDMELESQRKKHCNGCSGYRGNSFSYHCSDCEYVEDLLREKRRWKDIQEQETKYINRELEKINQEKAQNDTRSSKDYTDKKEFLINSKEKFKYYKTKHDMSIVTPIIKSLKELIKILEEKPIGYSMISTKTYLYIDETLNILEQLINMDEDLKERYLDKISQISNELARTVNELIERIERLEVEDIEVSMTVLLNELTKSEDKNA